MQSFNTVNSLSEHTSVPSACVTRHLHSPRRVAEKFHSLRLFFLNMTLRERIVMGQMPVHESDDTAVDQAYAEEYSDSDFDPVEHDAALLEARAATLIGVAKSACDVSRSSLPTEPMHAGSKKRRISAAVPSKRLRASFSGCAALISTERSGREGTKRLRPRRRRCFRRRRCSRHGSAYTVRCPRRRVAAHRAAACDLS
jgi:hypothetical protein